MNSGLANAVTPTFVIDLDTLRPLERLILDAEHGGYNSSAIVDAALERGLSLSDHPAYSLVRHHKSFVCLHKTHATDSSKQQCIDRQVGKEMVKCIRTHICNLRYRKAVRDEWGKQFVYWHCTDSELCRARVGSIEPTSVLRVEVVSPDCACRMRYVTKDDDGYAELYEMMQGLQASNPALVDVFRRNVQKSGWSPDKLKDHWGSEEADDQWAYSGLFWDDSARELHSTASQRRRQDRAQSVVFDSIESRDGECVGWTRERLVTLDQCDCLDYEKRGLPCKHMYRLAHEIGEFDLYGNDVESRRSTMNIPASTAVYSPAFGNEVDVLQLRLMTSDDGNPPTMAECRSLLERARRHRFTSIALSGILGSFGAHKFYHRQYALGVLYLLFCWTYVPGIVGIIEAVIYAGTSNVDWTMKHHCCKAGPKLDPHR